MTNRPQNWTYDTPPVDSGPFMTERGWEIALEGGADGLTEVLVAIQSGATKAGASGILSVTGPADGFYKAGTNLDFIVTFNEQVTVANTPRIAITLTSGTVYANYLSGSGTNELTFRYTVQGGDTDANGIAITSPIDLNTTGTITDTNGTGSTAVRTFTAPTLTNVIVDTTAPTVSTVESPQQGTDVNTGGTVAVTVTMSEIVTVTGTPRIPMFANDGTTPLGNTYATYASGSGTTTLTFNYTVHADDDEATGVKIGANISLNGGTIVDRATNAATLTFAQATTTVTLNQ